MYFKVDVMFSSLSMTAKGEMATRFREPGSDVQILLCTYRVGGVGQNLHTDCSNVVLFEARTSTSVEIQAYGRLRREGQGQHQVIWRLFQMDSINGYQEFKQLQKMRGEIAGWADSGMEDVLKDLLAADEDDDDQYFDLRRLSTLERAIDLYHAKLMGQRQTRGRFADFWGPVKVQDIAAKDVAAAKDLRNGPVA